MINSLAGGSVMLQIISPMKIPSPKQVRSGPAPLGNLLVSVLLLPWRVGGRALEAMACPS